ncbi:hypothetical protein D3C80_1513050 [compost metagenome]
MPQIPEDGRDPDNDQQTQRKRGDPQPFLPIERQSERRHPRGQQHEAENIEPPRLHFVVRHQP